jgi:hypothetical protein
MTVAVPTTNRHYLSHFEAAMYNLRLLARKRARICLATWRLHRRATAFRSFDRGRHSTRTECTRNFGRLKCDLLGPSSTAQRSTKARSCERVSRRVVRQWHRALPTNEAGQFRGCNAQISRFKVSNGLVFGEAAPCLNRYCEIYPTKPSWRPKRCWLSSFRCNDRMKGLTLHLAGRCESR